MSTSQQFEPANLLEIALKNAADDPAAGPVFYRELMESKVLIVPAGEKPRIVNGVVRANSQISIANLMFDGKPHVPFFSSEKRVPAGTEFLMLDARALFEITCGAPLVLNPGQPYGKQFLPDEVARLLDGTMFEPRERYVARKETQIPNQWKKPDDEPLFVAISKDNEQMLQAYTKARKTLPQFLSAIGSARFSGAVNSVKIKLRDHDTSEEQGEDRFAYLWLWDVRQGTGGALHATVRELPKDGLNKLKVGETFRFDG